MEDKKQAIIEEGKKKSNKTLIIGALIAIIAIGAFFLLKPTDATGASIGEVEPIDYAGLRADIVDVEIIEEGNSVGVLLDDLTKNKIVYFKYEDKPLMSYIDNQGNIITAVAMCEPCRNDHNFFIQDNVLVCGKCWTKWELTTHKGISGGCKEYPPEVLENEIVDGKVLVKKQEVIDWEPRV